MFVGGYRADVVGIEKYIECMVFRDGHSKTSFRHNKAGVGGFHDGRNLAPQLRIGESSYHDQLLLFTSNFRQEKY